VGEAGQGQGVARNIVVSNRTGGQRAKEGRRKDRGSDRHRLGEGAGQREMDGRKQKGEREGQRGVNMEEKQTICRTARTVNQQLSASSLKRCEHCSW